MPLIKNLIGRGIITSDELKQGINAIHNGEVISANGSVSERFLTLGPPLKGILGESTVVPELRKQAYEFAMYICLVR